MPGPTPWVSSSRARQRGTFGFILGPVEPDELAGLTDAERARLERLTTSMAGPGNGYFEVQATRLQTPAYALTDSPVGQLAWIVEKFRNGPGPPRSR
jgi:epoxide hydrolase